MKAHVEDAVSKGGKIVRGGRGHEAGQQFYEPTLIRDVPEDALIMREGRAAYYFILRHVATKLRGVDCL